MLIDPNDQAVSLVNDAIATDEDSASLSINLLANDSVPDLVQNVVIVQDPTQNSITLSTNFSNIANPIVSVVYTPDAALQSLALSETATDTFTYQVTDANGDTSTATVTVTITGTNDAPLITAEVGDSSGGTLAETNAGLQATGTLTASDVDVTDLITASVVGLSHTGPIGGLSDAQLSSLFEVTAGALDTAATTSGQLTWDFNSGAQAFDFLAVGEMLTLQYTIRPDDGHSPPAIGDGVVTITIAGTNDQPTLTIADTSGALTEGDGTPTLIDSGALSFADLDSNDAVTVSQTSNGDIAWSGGTIGAALAAALVAGFSVDQDSWDYSTSANLDFLRAGETITFSFEVVATDDSGAGNAASASTTVTITIAGTNDAPVAVNDAGSATEKGGIANGSGGSNATGNVLGNDTDVDTANASFTVTAIRTGSTEGVGTAGTLGLGLTGAHGTLTLNATGGYTYVVNEADAGVQALNVGGMLTDAFNYTMSDSTLTDQAVLTVTINGANDAPTIGGQSSGSVTEDSVTSVGGTLTIADPDAGQSSFQAQSGLAGNYGTLNINAAGNWAYFLNNSLPAVQALNTGQTLADTVNVLTADGTTQAIGITINGQDEANGFFGKQLTYQYLFSTIGSPFAAAHSFTTGAGLEVPQTGNAGSPHYAFNFNVDVSALSILITYVGSVGWSGASFNGFRIMLLTSPPRPTIPPKATKTFDANNIFVNWQGQSFFPGQTILINVTFGNSGNDPIVLDLNGDGVKFATGVDAVNFDLDASGGAELIAWASPQDGVLVIDLDGSGAIENGTEVLSQSFAGFGFGTSMEALRSLDVNLDGVVDAADGQFADLQVWRDANDDGVSQADELLSLVDLGIVSISVQEELRDEVIDGQQVYAAGTFT